MEGNYYRSPESLSGGDNAYLRALLRSALEAAGLPDTTVSECFLEYAGNSGVTYNPIHPPGNEVWVRDLDQEALHPKRSALQDLSAEEQFPKSKKVKMGKATDLDKLLLEFSHDY